MGKKINFLKKKTILDNILSNNDIVVVNNEQFSYANAKANLKKSNYTISYNNIDITSTYDSVKALYRNKNNNWLNDSYNISINEYENNVLKYNNYDSNGSQNITYTQYNNTINDNSLIIDSTYNSLYYVQPDKINLLSYSLNTRNGFNYDENNHVLYFNVDNKYIKSINNLLYYNYNNIRNTSSDKPGVAFIDDKYFDVKNNNNSYSNNTLTIIKEFKTEIFSTLNKIKNLYKECEVIYNTLEHFNTVNNNQDTLSLEQGTDYSFTFEKPKLYYSNYEIGIDSLDLSNVDTLYVFDLENAEFNIGYNNVKNYDHKTNTIKYNTAHNVNSSNQDLLRNRMSLTLAENEATADISYSHYYKDINGNKYPIGTTYNIKLNNLDENIFDNGISVLYKASPYIHTENNVQTISIPYKKELNIRKIAGSFAKYFYTTEIDKLDEINVEYLFVSSHYETKPFCVPKNSFDYLKSNNTITDCFNLQYFSMHKPNYTYDEVNPVLNVYPNNYINEKYFDSDLILYLDVNEENGTENIVYNQISDVNQIITNEDELSTCISKVRDVYLDGVKCLYFYRLRYNDTEGCEYFETIGDPNMLIFEEDIDSMLTFIARNYVKFTFTTHNEKIAQNLEYSLDGVTWQKFVEGADEFNIISDSGTYICKTGTIENSNKILWKLELENLINNELGTERNNQSSLLNYLNSGYGIGTFGSMNSNPNDNKDPKFEIFGNSMSLVYGETIKEPQIGENGEVIKNELGEDVIEYKTELINRPNIFRELFANSFISSARRLALPALTLSQSNSCYADMFNNCTLLHDCPVLPATVLSERCYKGMFKGCISLSDTPRLDAEIMKAECYKEMFMGCKGILTPPNTTKKYPTGILPSTDLNYGCYESMFMGCTGLYVMPQLVATIMKENCYKQMFMNCTNISRATPVPVIQEFAKSCFYFMFYNTQIIPHIWASGIQINICEGLHLKATPNDLEDYAKLTHNVQIGACQGLFGGTNIKESDLKNILPELSINRTDSNKYITLSATELSPECYINMFYWARELDAAPVLPANKLYEKSYYQMFYDCPKLDRIYKIDIRETDVECCYKMFWHAGNANNHGLTLLTNNINLGRNYYIDRDEEIEKNNILAKKCFYEMFFECFNLLNGPKYVGGPQTMESQYECCYNMFYNCDYMQYSHSNNNSTQIAANKLGYAAYAHMFENCISLEKGPVFVYYNNYGEADDFACENMFMNCEEMTTVTSLIPIKTIGVQTYAHMFENCKKLVTGPEIVATTITEIRYSNTGEDKPGYESCLNMFMNCEKMTSLASNEFPIFTHSRLNISSLGPRSYAHMFENCKSLLNSPYINVHVVDYESCLNMFMDCENMKTTNNELYPTELFVRSYSNMFNGCKSLENMVKIDATSVNNESCMQMFYGCEKMISTSTLSLLPLKLAERCYYGMYYGCSLLTLGPTIYATKVAKECCMRMFEGCTSLTNAPSSLQATNLEEACYKNMFKDCTSLASGPTINANVLASQCCMSMFEGCTGLIKSPTLLAEELIENCYTKMFYGCTSLIFIKALFLTGPIKDIYGNNFVMDNNKQIANYTDDWVYGVKNFDVNNENGIDTYEDYNANYSNHSISQIDFTTEFESQLPRRTDIEQEYNGDNTYNDYEDYNNNMKYNGLGRFIRNQNAHLYWDIKDNIGIDAIPATWSVYKESVDANNREYPIFVFFHSNSHRNNEDYSKLIYGLTGDLYDGIPVYNEQDPENGDFYRRGHTFLGWSLNERAINDEQSNIVSLENITFGTTDKRYFAVWSANEYDITWHYIVDREYTITNQGIYETSISNYIPDPNNTLYNLTTPVPTHQYPKNNQNIQKDGYIFWCWSSIENPLEQLDYVNYNTPTDYFIRTIDNRGNDLDKTPNTPNSFETDTVGLSEENHFYAVWKYIVKWNVNSDYNEGYYTPDSDNNIIADYYYQNNYFYNDYLSKTQDGKLDVPNPAVNNNGKYKFGGWATNKGPVEDNPYLPDIKVNDNTGSLYSETIDEIYSSIQRGVDKIPTLLRENCECNHVKTPKNYYTTWRYEIIWYEGNNGVYTPFVTNYGYYNDHAVKYRPMENNGVDYKNPERQNCTFYGWASEPNLTNPDLDDIIIKNSGSDDNKIYPVWKYGVVWMTRKNNADENCGYYTAPYTNGYSENCYEQSEYLYGDTLILPDRNPVRDDEDYIFDTTVYNDVWSGWADYAGPQQDKGIWKPNISKTYQVKDSTTFYAVYKPAITWYYVVTSDNVKTYGYYYDNALNYKPENPSINRYVFVGWNTSANQTTALTEITITNPGSNKIYAVWEYSVKWNTYGGSYSSTENGYSSDYYYKDGYKYNDSLGEYGNATHYPQINPTRTDYEFGGWCKYQGPSRNDVWEPNIENDYKVVDSVDFYAVWKSAIYWYDYDGTLLATTYGFYNDNVSNYKPSDPTRTGYTFQGWNTNNNQSINNIKVGDPSNNKFYAAYTVNKYTIYWYNYDGTILLKTTTGDYDSLVSLHIPKNDDNTNYEPTIEGYTFQGWNTNTGQTSGNIDNIRVKTSGNNFYAAYTVNSYSIIFKLGDSNYTYINSSGTTVISATPNYNTSLGDAVNPWPTAGGSPQYKDTTRWKKEGTNDEVDSNTTIKGSMTLVPINGDLREFTVTFKVAGSVYESVTTSSVKRYYDEEIGTLPTASDDQGVYQNTSRWQIEGGSEVFSTKRVYNDMTLIPIRENPNEHTVTFRCSDGFTINGNTEVSYSCTHNNSISTCLPNGTWPSATRVGYNPDPITTWKFNSGGNDGTTANLDYTVTDNIVLYMDTTEIAPKTYTVTFKVGDTGYDYIDITNHPAIYDCMNVSYGTTLGSLFTSGTLPQAIDNDGAYESTTRWETNENDSEEVTAQTVVTSDMTLVPIPGGIQTFTVTFMVGNTGYDYIGVSDYPTSYSKNDVPYGTTLGSLFTSGTLPMAYDNDGEYANTDVWKIDGTSTIVTANFEVKSDLTLIPTRSVSKHTVTWHYNYYETGTTFKVETETDQYYHGSAIGTLKTASRDCAFFDGWYDNPSFTGNQIGTDYVINDDTHLYAKWTLKEYFRTTFNAKSYSYKVTVGLELYSATRFPSYGWEDDTLQYSEDEGLTWNIVTKPTSSSTNIIWTIENTSKSIIWRGTQKTNHSAPTSIGWLNIVSSRIDGGTAGGECDLSGYLSSLVHNNSFVDINNGNIEYKTDGYYYNTFSSLFYNCDSIGSASSLKLNLMGILVYNYMFGDCRSLVYPPILSTFNTISPACFMGMFSGCFSLNEVPILPNVNLYHATSSTEVYDSMFKNCISLTTVPNDLLKSTTLTASCYASMFEGCTALTNAPELPASTLAYGCYASMFKGCTSLITAPVLNAETLVPECYKEMFNGCSSLRKIECYAINISAEDCTKDWVVGVPTDVLNGRDVAGDFYRSENNNDWAVFDVNGIPTNWEIHPNLNIITVPWFAITCNISGSNGDGIGVDLWMSTNSNTEVYYGYENINGQLENSDPTNPTWHQICSGASGYVRDDGSHWWSFGFGGPLTEGQTSYSRTIFVKANGHVYFDMSTFSTSNANSNVTVEFSVSGNPITLKAGTNKVVGGGTYYFGGNNANLFARNNTYKSTLLTDASKLELYRSDINMISSECYKDMFANCVGLTIPPALPSPTLANNCYEEMFYGCTSLSSLPSLGAQTLAFRCYSHMFGNCSSLTQVPSNYLNITTLEERCYEYMFEGCTALTSAPELPASTLQLGCYQYMFNNCTSLITLPTDMIKATTLAEECCRWMFHNCSSLTNSDQHLVLHAETLARACYEGMFYECVNLHVIICLATYGMYVSSSSDSENYDPDYELYVRSTEGWVVREANVNQTIYPNSDGKFYKNSQTEFKEQTGSGKNYWGRGGTGVPYEWQVLNYGGQSQYNITWNINYSGGSNPTPTSVVPGGAVGELPTVNRYNYTFKEWNTAQDGTGTTVNSSYIPSGNMTVYAQWISTITWNVNYSGGENLSPNNVLDGNSITVPTATRTGYTFNNWNFSQNGTGTTIVAGTQYTPNGHIIWYAQWASTITWDVNYTGGTNPSSTKVPLGNAISNVLESLPTPNNRTGYTFNGWNTAQNGSGTTVSLSDTPNGDIIFYAQWTENQQQTYTITWNAGGGLFEVLDVNFSDDLVYDENNNLIGFSIQIDEGGLIPIPSWIGDDETDSYKFYRTGYSFVDWYDSPAEPLQQDHEDWDDDYPIQSDMIASENKTYYARWRVSSKQNLVLFEDLENQPLYTEISPLTDQESSVDVHVITDYGYADGVANDGKFLIANVSVTSGDALISPSNKEGSGPSGAWSQSLSGVHIFEDVVYSTINNDETEIGDDNDQMEEEEHHIGIKMFWIKTPNSYNNTSNISVEIVGASGTTNGVSDFTTFQNNYELTTQFSVTTISDNGGGTPGGNPTEEDEDTYYDVSFDGNYEDWDGDNIINYETISVKANNPISSAVDSLPEPQRSGYTFNGWNTDPDGNGDEVTLDYIVTETIMLYAQWT